MDQSNPKTPQPGVENPGLGGRPPSSSGRTKMIVIALAAILLVIAGGLALLLGSNEDGSSVSDPASQNSNIEEQTQVTNDGPIEVFITSEGFSPSMLRIDAGATVRWTNQDTEPHIISSNPHPVHTDLVGLDSVDPVGPGASYEYTFDSVGTYGYHDHLDPLINGDVIVE